VKEGGVENGWEVGRKARQTCLVPLHVQTKLFTSRSCGNNPCKKRDVLESIPSLQCFGVVGLRGIFSLEI
jgi:hypothetical protein